MTEKLVNVQVRMVLENGKLVVRHEDGVHWTGAYWTPAMHAAAEELRAQGAELGENQFLHSDGDVVTLSEPTADGYTASWVGTGGKELSMVCQLGGSWGDPLTQERIRAWHAKNYTLAWHAKNYTLAPDECREPGRPPRKMVDGEARGADGAPMAMHYHGPEPGNRGGQVHLGEFSWFPGITRRLDAVHPCADSSQYGRALAFWARNAPADLCLTDDGHSVRTMEANEVRDVVTGKGLELVSEPSIGGVSIFRDGGHVATYNGSSEVYPTWHPCSLPSNRLRVEAFLAANQSPVPEPEESTPRSDTPGSATTLAVSAKRESDGYATSPERAQQSSVMPTGEDGCNSHPGVNVDAVLPEAHSGSPKGYVFPPLSDKKIEALGFCAACKGTGRSKLRANMSGTWLKCPACTGTGRKTEESDGLEKPGSVAEKTGEATSKSEDRRVQTMTLSREAEEGEPTRPSYVPDGVPWAWVTDGLGKRVPAYVTDGQVVLWSGSGGEWYPPARPTVYGPPLCDELRAILRAEIGWGHKKDSGVVEAKARDLSTPLTQEGAATSSGELKEDETKESSGRRHQMRLTAYSMVGGPLLQMREVPLSHEKQKDWWTVGGRAELERNAKTWPSEGWPRALAFFEEHCRKENVNGEETQDSLVGRADGGPVSGLAALAGTGADGAGSAVAEMLGGDSAEEPIGGHEVAPSPADGPAKVFENETEAFGHLIAGPRDWRGKQAYDWLKLRGVNVEGVMLKALPRILERLPAEQVVQAMAPDLQLALFKVAQHPFAGHHERVKAWGEETARLLNEALARAEKAETWWTIGNRETSLKHLLDLAVGHGFDPERGGIAEFIDLTCRAAKKSGEWYAKLQAVDAHVAEAIARAERAETKLRRQASTMAYRLDAVADAAGRTLENLGVIRLRDAIERARASNRSEPGSEFAETAARAEKAEREVRDIWRARRARKDTP